MCYSPIYLTICNETTSTGVIKTVWSGDKQVKGQLQPSMKVLWGS